ncbi:hypothetical protein BOX17_13900 [Halomonas aestuarii]|uniref:Biotin carboxylation domain-containing protein n=1 Tax=Halomonas aestuarii TaxID=1897729 RepID=A0A1J0VIV7_9GAMM|nr:hypothetical protein [Halomonas aestuarii]APE31950.1 hypothetical protein BOX17_13900 [Halomonas aestuarii]
MSRPSERPLSRLLVAAGGLVGLRLQQACDELGIQACLAEGEPEALVARARALGCDALHPGKAGAEDQVALDEACGRAGLRLIAPGTALLTAMVDRAAVRQRMRASGLPLSSGEEEGRQVRVAVLADARGRVVHLGVHHVPWPGLALSPVPWLTPEQRCYLGRLAVQGVSGLGLVGLVVVSFRVAGNRIGVEGLSPGLVGTEALDEALIGLDPLVEQLRLAAGEPLRQRQAMLEARGHALLWRFPLPREACFSGGPGLRLDRLAEDGEAGLLAWGRRPEVAWRRGRRALVELLGAREAAARLP